MITTARPASQVVPVSGPGSTQRSLRHAAALEESGGPAAVTGVLATASVAPETVELTVAQRLRMGGIDAATISAAGAESAGARGGVGAGGVSSGMLGPHPDTQCDRV